MCKLIQKVKGWKTSGLNELLTNLRNASFTRTDLSAEMSARLFLPVNQTYT